MSGWKIVEEYEKVRNTKSPPILSLKLLRKGWGCTERKIKKKKKVNCVTGLLGAFEIEPWMAFCGCQNYVFWKGVKK